MVKLLLAFNHQRLQICPRSQGSRTLELAQDRYIVESRVSIVDFTVMVWVGIPHVGI